MTDRSLLETERAATTASAAPGAATPGDAPVTTDVAIEFRGLYKRFGPDTNPYVLGGIDLAVERGSFVSLIGASGCGKSTLLRIAGDLIEPTSGLVTIDGAAASDARLGHKVGFVFQAANLCPWRNARRNVELPLETIGVPKKERRERAMAHLEMVGLADAADRYPHQLSGGMAQRVAIARALVFDPEIVLLDEPFGALDEFTRDRLNIELHELWERTGKTVLFVTHSISEAVFLSTHIVVMGRNPGRVASVYEPPLPRRREAAVADTEEFFHAVTAVRGALVEQMGDTV